MSSSQFPQHAPQHLNVRSIRSDKIFYRDLDGKDQEFGAAGPRGLKTAQDTGASGTAIDASTDLHVSLIADTATGTLYLPLASKAKQVVRVHDGSTGGASTYNINILPSGSDFLDGATGTAVVLSTNAATLAFVAKSDSQWISL